jgi:hydrogenase maturation protease
MEEHAKTFEKTLVIGVGNPIHGDDGVGVLLGRLLRERLGEGADFIPFSGSALDLLSHLDGRRSVVIIDSVTGGSLTAGECARIDIEHERSKAPAGISSHCAGILTSIQLAEALAFEMPRDLRLYGIGIQKPKAYHEGLSELLSSRIPVIIEQIAEDLG